MSLSEEDSAPPADMARRSAHGGALTVVSQGGRFLVRLASQVVLARLLMPADYGLIAMLAPVLGLVSLLGDLGLAQVTMIQREVTHQQVTSLFWLGLMISSGLGLVVALSAPLLALIFEEPRLTLLALSFAVLMPVSSAATQHLALNVRRMRFGILALSDVLAPLLGLLGGIAAALSGWGYWSLVVSSAGESITAAVIMIAASRWWPGLPRFTSETWSLFKIGGHLTGFNIANYLTTSVDNILLGLVYGKVALGLYDKGYKTVTQPMAQLTAPFSRIAVPVLARLEDDGARYRSAYRRLVELMLLGSFPALLVLTIFSKPVVRTLFGPNWIGMAPVIAWLCIGAFGSTLYSSVSWLFVSQKRTGEQLTASLITSAAAIAGFLAGLPWGAAGVAGGAALAFIFVCVPQTCWAVGRTGPVGWRDILAMVAPFVLAACGTAIVLWLAKGLLGVRASSLPWLCATGFLAYACFLLFLGISPSGRRALRDVVAARNFFMPSRARN